MKKKYLIVFIMMYMFCSTVYMNNVDASTTSNIKKLVKSTNMYEYTLLSKGPKKSKTVTLSNSNVAKAAALSLKISSLKHYKDLYGGEVSLYKLPSSKVKAASKNIFGKSVSTNSLKKKKSGSGDLDAYRTSSNVPVVMVSNVGGDCDYSVTNISIKKKNKNSYTVTKKVYCGYWGNNKGKPNYKIMYTVSKKKKTKYVYVIKKMSYKKL